MSDMFERRRSSQRGLPQIDGVLAQYSRANSSRDVELSAWQAVAIAGAIPALLTLGCFILLWIQ